MVGPPGTLVPFEIGSLGWQGVTACQRCAVPTRASDSGEPIPMFQKSFAERREASLPAWANPARFDHFYRLAVNTRPAAIPAAGQLQVGDPVRLA
jgi:uncharacterized protein YcbX